MNTTNYPENLVGRTTLPTKHCDTCPNEPWDCKKLILAGGEHICVSE